MRNYVMAVGGEERAMVWSLVHWAITVLAIGVVAGLVLASAAAVGLLWLRRWVRRKFQTVAWVAAGNVGRRLAERRIAQPQRSEAWLPVPADASGAASAPIP
jgi:hypothetical protein